MPSVMRLIFLIVLCLTAGIPSARSQDDAQTEIKIGVIVPLTGDMAMHGLEIQRAIQLALDQKRGTYFKYRAIFEDNQLDGLKSAAAAQRLLAIEHVDAVITLWPPTASVVIPFTERAQKLHYTISWDPDLARKNRFVLSHQAMATDIAHATVRLIKENHKTRVAFLHMEETGFNLGAQNIRSAAGQEGLDMIADEAFSPAEHDFRSLIERTEAKHPDCYLVWAVLPSLDIVLRQIRTRNRDIFLTGYFDYAQDTTPIQRSIYVSEMYAAEAFRELYRGHFQSEPVTKGANAYDITNLIIAAFEAGKPKKSSAAELKSFLTKIHDYHGAVGTFSIDRFGNSSYRPAIRKIQGTERVLVSIPK